MAKQYFWLWQLKHRDGINWKKAQEYVAASALVDTSEAGDASFPNDANGMEPVPFRAWFGGMLLFAAAIGFIMRNVFGAAEGSWVGGGNIEQWLWLFWWLKSVLISVWTSGDWWLAIKTTLACCSFPEYGSVGDLLLFSWPLQLLLGDPWYYTAKVFLFLWLNCVACWWFLSRVWGQRTCAWVGALIYGLNPFFLNEIVCGRVRQALGFTVPVCLFYLYRVWRFQGRKDVLWAGLWLGLTFFFYSFYGLMLCLLALALLLWHAFIGKKMRSAPQAMKRIGFSLLIGLVLALPTNLSFVQGVVQGAIPLWPGWQQSNSGNLASAKNSSNASSKNFSHLQRNYYQTASQAFAPLKTLTKGRDSIADYVSDPIIRNQRQALTESLPVDALWNCPNAYIAFSLIVLLLVFFPGLRPTKLPVLWLSVFFAFLIFSWGPYLGLGSSSRTYLSDLLMPYAYLTALLPGLIYLGSPDRLLLLVYLALAVLSCWRLKQLSKGSHSLCLGLACLVTIGIFLQWELTAKTPLQLVRLGVAPFYYVVSDRQIGATIDVPFQVGEYLDYNQTVSHLPSLGSSCSSVLPAGLPESKVTLLAKLGGGSPLLADNSFIKLLHAINIDRNNLPSYRGEDLSLLNKNGYKYLVLHERGCNILNPKEGELIYFSLFNHFRTKLGEPVLCTDEPVFENLPGRHKGETADPAWYRMCVFSLEGKQSIQSR